MSEAWHKTGFSLSATTLTTEQIPKHQHTFERAPMRQSEFVTGVQVYSVDGNVKQSFEDKTSFVGKNGSHTHGITNPEHTHTATATFDVTQSSRALYYIMRCA